MPALEPVLKNRSIWRKLLITYVAYSITIHSVNCCREWRGRLARGCLLTCKMRATIKSVARLSRPCLLNHAQDARATSEFKLEHPSHLLLRSSAFRILVTTEAGMT